MLFVASWICVVASAFAQSPQSGYGGTAQPRPGASAPAPRLVDLRPFILETAQGTFASAELGRLAVTRAASPDVKRFARQMVEAGEKMTGELKPLLEAQSLAVPTEIDTRHKVTRDWLMKLSGTAFDRAYMAAMTAKLANDATFFERASLMSRDADVKAWATKALPIVKDHQKAAKEVTLSIAAGPAAPMRNR
jgi:putative membrane protein